jgi:sporulation-control protein spo0M
MSYNQHTLFPEIDNLQRQLSKWMEQVWQSSEEKMTSPKTYSELETSALKEKT